MHPINVHKVINYDASHQQRTSGPKQGSQLPKSGVDDLNDDRKE